jgi:hypothetical protein
MFVLAALLIVVSNAARPPALRPPVIVRVAAQTTAGARPDGRRPAPAVIHRRATRRVTSVAGDRTALPGPPAARIDPPKPHRPLPSPALTGPRARDAAARAQRGPPLRAR